MRGPSWNYEAAHSYGASADDMGVVNDLNLLESDQEVGVKWPDGERFIYAWGKNDKYDIQLHHKSTVM